MRGLHTTCSIIALTFLLAGCATSRPPEKSLVLKPGGFDIVVPDDAPPAHRYAAEELARFLGEALGEPPPVVNRAQWRRPCIVLRSAENLGNASDESFRITIGRRRALIEGNSPRGTLYAAYEFLEKHAGVRFLTAEHTHVPKLDQLRLLPGETAFSPPFAFRWSFYHELNQSPSFAARLRNNGTTHAAKLGGASDAPLLQHSMHRFVPVETYGETHPEYFAQLDGVRMLDVPMGQPQVCSTNPRVIDLVTEAVLREIRENPDLKVVSVSPNDNAFYCTCPQCAAIDAREGTHMAAHLYLVNAVAERVSEQHPGIRIGTLAYWHTRKPPAHMRVHPNVRIQFCTFESCALHSLDAPNCPPNADIRNDLENWLALTDDVWVWHYVANLHQLDLPLPNWESLGPTLRYFREVGVRGVFAHGNGRCPAGEMSDLRNYVVSRLLWDPDLNAKTLIEEFVSLHYGPQAGAIQKYLGIVQQTTPQALHPAIFSSAHDMQFTGETAWTVMQLFNEAIMETGDDRLRKWLRKASLPGHRLVAETTGTLSCAKNRLFVDYPPEVRPTLIGYPALCAEFGMDRNGEFTPMAAYFEALQRNIAGAPAERLENTRWRVTLSPVMGGTVVDLFHKPSGYNLLRAYGNAGINLPYGTLSEAIRQGPGAAERAFQITRTEDRALLTRELPDGSVYSRSIATAKEGVEFVSSYQHFGDASTVVQFDVTANLHVEGFDVPEIHVLLEDGTWKSWVPPRVRAVPYMPEPCPAPGGLVTIPAGQNGSVVVLKFDAGQFEPPRFAWNAGLRQVEVYLTTKQVRLGRGGRFGFSYAFDYVDDDASFRATLPGSRHEAATREEIPR